MLASIATPPQTRRKTNVHFCPEELRLLMILVDYCRSMYHYYVCAFKVRFLGAKAHDLSDHGEDDGRSL